MTDTQESGDPAHLLQEGVFFARGSGRGPASCCC